MKIRFTQKAKDQLIEIFEYYKDNSQARYGRQIRAKIISRTSLLKDHPYTGQEEENLKHLQQGHRYLVEGNYKIIYRVEGNAVLIIRIFDTRQDPGKLTGQ